MEGSKKTKKGGSILVISIKRRTAMSKIQDWINKRNDTERVIGCGLCMAAVIFCGYFVYEKTGGKTPDENFKKIESIEKKIESIEKEIHNINVKDTRLD